MGKFYVFCKGYAKYERKGKTFVILKRFNAGCRYLL